MTDITILICLYNKEIDASDTIQSLLKANLLKANFKIIVWDNSFVSLSKDSIELLNNNFSNFIYKHTPENVYLSKIYNEVIKSLREKNSYLMICDDDSYIPNHFFEVLLKQIKLNPSINLFLPQIYSESILVSPAKDYLIITKFLKELMPGVLDSRYTTAINSGMVISNRVFKSGFRYNENLKFYGTDNFFMNKYSEKNRHLIVLDVKISHNLSFNSTNNIINKLRIFREIKRANKIIYQNQFLKRQILFINNLFVAIKLCLKYKSLKFLFT